MTNLLIKFKFFIVDKETLKAKLGGDLHNVECKCPEVIQAADVINAIDAFLTKRIIPNQLLDWVNTVWFTDLFEFQDEETDSIVSVLQVLETMDEDNVFLPPENFSNMIAALQNNKEYYLT